MLKRKKGFASIWVGQIPTRDQFDAYLAADLEHKPINPFATDCGVKSYDTDTVEVNWQDDRKKQSVKAALATHSYAEFFLADALALAAERGVQTANSTAIAYDLELSPARWPESSPLTFLGTLPYEEIKVKAEPPQPRSDDHHSQVMHLSTSPDGRWALSSADEELRLWDLATGQHVATQQLREMFIVEFWLPDNRFLTKSLLSSQPGFTLWEAGPSGIKRVKRLNTPEEQHRVQPNASGDGLMLMRESPELVLFDAWRLSKQPEYPGVMAGTQLLGERWVVLEFYAGIIEVWDLKSKACLRKFPVVDKTNPARGIVGAVSDSQIVVQVKYDGTIFVVDIETGEKVLRLQRSERLNDEQSVIYGRNQRFLSGVGGSTMCGYLRTWNLVTGELVAGVDLKEVNVRAAFAPQAKLAAAVSYDANVHLLRLDTWKEVARWRIAPESRSVETDTEEGDGYELTAVGISPDGKTITVGEASGRVHLLRYERGNLKAMR